MDCLFNNFLVCLNQKKNDNLDQVSCGRVQGSQEDVVSGCPMSPDITSLDVRPEGLSLVEQSFAGLFSRWL